MRLSRFTRALGVLASFFMSGATSLPAATNAPRNTVILLIRHGEKTGDKEDRGLSKAGAKRAQRYVDYFRHYAIDGKSLKLDTAIAAAESKHSNRPVETLQPTAQALKIPLEHQIDDKDYAALAKEFQDGKYNGKNVLVCWHHGKIPELLDALGATSATYFPDHHWNEQSFCWLFQLQFDDQGRLNVTAKNVSLLKGDEAFGKPGP